MKHAALIIGWNRPEYFRQVLDAVAKNDFVSRIYIHLDGPRNSDDIASIGQCLELTKNPSIRSQLFALVRDTNLGKKKGPEKAIDWFFENEESGFILEDDCRPSPEFFSYSSVLLRRFRNNPSIALISGHRPAPDLIGPELTFSISKQVVIWGWASWRDRWVKHDQQMADWPYLTRSQRNALRASSAFGSRTYYREIFGAAHSGRIPTWDYQFFYSVRRYGLHTCIPSANLVQNLDTPTLPDLWTSPSITNAISPEVFVLEDNGLLRSLDRWIDVRVRKVPLYFFQRWRRRLLSGLRYARMTFQGLYSWPGKPDHS